MIRNTVDNTEKCEVKFLLHFTWFNLELTDTKRKCITSLNLKVECWYDKMEEFHFLNYSRDWQRDDRSYHKRKEFFLGIILNSIEKDFHFSFFNWLIRKIND